jgi:Putative peptidase family
MDRELMAIALATALCGYATDGGSEFRVAQPPKLQIRIIDLAGVSPGILAPASATADSILRSAGIATEWAPVCAFEHRFAPTPGPDGCRTAIRKPGREVTIRILSERYMGLGIDASTLAFTNLAMRSIYIFYPHITASQLAGISRRYALLGAVMAHETAHLLGLGHSDAGIMRAGFRDTEVRDAVLSRLGFSDEEASSLREGALRWTSERGMRCELEADGGAAVIPGRVSPGGPIVRRR